MPTVRLQDGSTRLKLQMMGGEYSTAKISRNGLIWCIQPFAAWHFSLGFNASQEVTTCLCGSSP